MYLASRISSKDCLGRTVALYDAVSEYEQQPAARDV